ncbi:MAG: TetR family transcriptional regulator [Gordonia sp. (in: high G+C Gram-positive bacteria)]|uniref:TetR/AcrR family transcriptional regulator n=1 Tax=Gordonia TaxID=2053 RepID=UPI0032675C22
MIDHSTVAAPGTTPGPRPGLRERQKAQTRADIRAAALRLILDQGYEATTVAQIADAANVSHTTFFRYFQSKEQVIISDDLDAQRESIFASIPAGLTHFGLVRELIIRMFEIVEADPWASNPDRFRIIRTEPVLYATFQLESDRIISEATDVFADYLGISPNDRALRVFVAAISGVMFHLSDVARYDPDAGPTTADDCLSALDVMEQGFPLATPNRTGGGR